MPCDSIRRVSVDLSALGRIDPKLLAAALKDLGHVVTVYDDGSLLGQGVTYRSGKLELTGYAANRTTLEQVKQAYGAQVVKATAKKYGWAIKETAKYQYEIIKR